MENRKTVSISKQKLALLPPATFPGKITLINTREAADAAAAKLMKESIVGFDTETKPSFKRGHYNKVSLLQLSTREECFLFRLNYIGLPPSVKQILENPQITKVGLSIHDDFHNLGKIFSLEPDGFIDLQQFVKDYMIADNSLSRIYGIIFNERISKGQRLTNWEAEDLTIHQQGYAALDAYACIKIYDYLTAGKFEPLKSEYCYELPQPEA